MSRDSDIDALQPVGRRIARGVRKGQKLSLVNTFHLRYCRLACEEGMLALRGGFRTAGSVPFPRLSER
jgi:hypothetical protein